MMSDANNEDAREQIVIQNLMHHEDGRKWVMKYLNKGKLFDSTFDTDPIKHAHAAGMREMTVTLHREIREADPNNYMKMIKESIDG
jgi:hypothetical protein